MAFDNIDKIICEEYAGLPAITEPAMQKTVKTVINNTLKVISEDAPATTSGMVDQYTPVVISLIRRVLPTLVGPQMVGMQAMNLPTGRIFVQRVYAIDRLNQKTWEVWGGAGDAMIGENGNRPYAHHEIEQGIYDPIDDRFTGGVASYSEKNREEHWDASHGYYNYGSLNDVDDDGNVKVKHGGKRPMSTHDGEQLGWKVYGPDKNFTIAPYPEMAFGIEAVDVFTKTRKLKGRLTQEVIQDLRAVHGLDAESELANILQAEIAAEIDREIVTRISSEATMGAQNCATAGVFDFAVDADGRWAMEKVMSLLIQIEREATIIAQQTRRGRGNFILTSPEVAAYLSMANLITFIQNTGFTPIINPVGTSYYGMLCNRFKVFVDPYMTSTNNEHVVIVGYKGNSVYDSGLFYCPYVPIQWWKATGEEDGGTRLGISSRYGLISNPYSSVNKDHKQQAVKGTNAYFRKFFVKFSA